MVSRDRSKMVLFETYYVQYTFGFLINSGCVGVKTKLGIISMFFSAKVYIVLSIRSFIVIHKFVFIAVHSMQ